jgi:hypothetical protein
MTETINNANAAASTLFLGQNGEFWDFWLIIAGICVAVAATAVGVTTAGSIVAHKREAAASEEALDRYKLGTSKEIAEANARAVEASLALQRLSTPRMLDVQPFKAELAGISPPAKLELLYVEECSDCFLLASMMGAVLNDMKWPYELAPLKKLESGPSWLLGLPATMQHRAKSTGVSVVSRHVREINIKDKSTEAAVARAIFSSIMFAAANFQWAGDPEMPEGEIKIVIAPRV